MLRHTQNATRVRFRAFATPRARLFNTSACLTAKEHVGHMLQQARSSIPHAYKTVRNKTADDEDTATHKSRIIWLAKYCHAEDSMSSSELSPHNLPWLREEVNKAAVTKESEVNEHVVVTVWPHLW